MYASDDDKTPLYQLVINENIKALDSGFEQKYNKINMNLKSFKKILPVDASFVKRGNRTYKGYKIERYVLELSKNKESIFARINLNSTEDGNDVTIRSDIEFENNYYFELTENDKIEIFAGGDRTDKFMNRVIDYQGSNTKKDSVFNQVEFTAKTKQALENATINIYFSLLGYAGPQLRAIERTHAKGDGRVAKMLAETKLSWNILSYRLNRRGIKSRLILNSTDLVNLMTIFNRINYLSPEK